MAELPLLIRRWRFVGLLALALLATPLIFGSKNGAVFGHFSYWQFLIVLLLFFFLGFAVFIAFLPANKRRAVAINLSLSLVASLLALGVFEGALFFIPVKHQMDNPWYVFAGGGLSTDDELPYGRPAHLHWEGLSRGDLAITSNEIDPYAQQVVFKTDRDGFRNHTEIEQADVVVVGDSFTEAGNMPEADTYVARLAKKLNTEVRNLGRAGYTSATELIVLERYGLKNQPRTVVWQVAESNDLFEAGGHDIWVASGRPQFFGKMLSGYTGWLQRSPTHRLFRLLRRPPEPVGGRFLGHDGKWHPMRFQTLPSPHQMPRDNPGWATFISGFRRAHEICRQNNIRMVVLLIPMKYRVMGPLTELNEVTKALLAELPPLPAEESLSPKLAGVCRELGVTYVDSTAALSARARAGELVYLPFDTHLSNLGHEVVANVVAGAINGQSPATAGEVRPSTATGN